MARTDTLGHFLTDVADAIRTKAGTSGTIQASDFDTEIENLPSGGGKYAPRYIRFTNYAGTELDDELENLDVSNMTTLTSMFQNCYSLTSVDIPSYDWDTSNITSISSMFSSCRVIQEIDMSDCDLSNVITSNTAFSNCFALTNVTFPTNIFSNVSSTQTINLQGLFEGCRAITTIDLSFLPDKKYNGRGMFYDCQSVTQITFPNSFNCTGSDSYLFNQFLYNCQKLESIDFSSIILPTNINYNFGSAFLNCKALTSIDFTEINKPSQNDTVTYAYNMFNGCTSLMFINMSNLDFSTLTSGNFGGMFGSGNTAVPTNCEIIVKDTANKTWMNTNFPSYTNVKTVAEYEAE